VVGKGGTGSEKAKEGPGEIGANGVAERSSASELRSFASLLQWSHGIGKRICAF